ncbi:MAG TPA: tyrosine-type recombinase/integrase [Firmicutes bacterium]|nr:tyrosine-type recombinase/integrase [Bacillota bacterium]
MGKILRIDKKIPGTWQDALQDFLFWKQAQGIAPRTLTDYRKHITQFFTRYPDAYNPANLRQRVLEYMAEDIMPATFNLRREYLKAFFSWCVREGIFPRNPFHDIPKKKDPGKIRHLPEDVLQRLLSLPDRSTFSGLRDYALILLTLATGIRPGEALSILPADINLRGLSITIKSSVSKTRQEAVLPIPPQVAEAIRELLNARHPSWHGNVPVFCSYSGRPLTVDEFGDRLERYSKKLGTKVTPYMLRHSFAIETLRGGANAFVVQAMLRHSTMNMTRRYVNLVESDLREAMAKANPLNKLMPQAHRVRKLRRD